MFINQNKPCKILAHLCNARGILGSVSFFAVVSGNNARNKFQRLFCLRLLTPALL